VSARSAVALTFDDGPSTWTEEILDLLAAHGARATFFVIGSNATARSDLIRRMATEGHEVGNHSWSHPWLARECDAALVEEELTRTNAVLEDILGFPPTRFRAPRYDVDAKVEDIAARLGLRHTRGDLRPPDWKPACTAAFIATFVLSQLQPGQIVGLHDGVPPDDGDEAPSRRPTVEAVAIMLPQLVDRGFACVTASTVLAL